MNQRRGVRFERKMMTTVTVSDGDSNDDSDYCADDNYDDFADNDDDDGW